MKCWESPPSVLYIAELNDILPKPKLSPSKDPGIAAEGPVVSHILPPEPTWLPVEDVV